MLQDAYFLSLTYRYEDENGEYEVHYPKIILYIVRNSLPKCKATRTDSMTVNFGMGEFDIFESPQTKTIREKEYEMTLEEIEEKLGYKVKIVEKKERRINNDKTRIQ